MAGDSCGSVGTNNNGEDSMELLNITRIPKKKQQIAGRYVLEGVKYVVQPLTKDRISLVVHNPNGHCHFGGCKVIRSGSFLKRKGMIKL